VNECDPDSISLCRRRFLGPHDLHNRASRLLFSPTAEACFETETTRLCVMSAHFFPLAGRKAADIGALRSECPFFLVLVVGCLAAFPVILGGTCGAPRVIAPWRGERDEWFPVSNPDICRVVGMRKDGRMLRLFRGRRRTYSSPLGSPIWGFTAHVGGRAPSRVHMWVSPHFLSLWLFLSSPSACVPSEAWPVLYRIVFTAVLLACCVY
jgi:hypothetical protein